MEDDRAFKIIGGKKAKGSVTISGSKNAAFPLLAIPVLFPGKYCFSNVPQISDITTFLHILNSLGLDILKDEKGDIIIDSDRTIKESIPPELGSLIRGEMYLVGALLARKGKVQFPFPGGCDVGERGIDLHIKTLKSFGANIKLNTQGYDITGNNLYATTIELPYPSRGVTGNALILSSSITGKTIINNANTSPEIVYLEKALSKIGVKISGIGTTSLCVEGIHVDHINSQIIIPSDKIETATYVVAAMITNGEILIHKAPVHEMKDFFLCISKMGAQVDYLNENTILVQATNEKHILNILTGLPPKLDPDYEPLLAAFLSTLQEPSIIEDYINPMRHTNYLSEFSKLGVIVEEINTTKALIRMGDTGLLDGKTLCGKDLRSAIALILLALFINGETTVLGVRNVERGYEKLLSKMKGLGLDVSIC